MNRQIAESVKEILDRMCDMLHQLQDEQFSLNQDVLSGASLGEHVRHVIEFFQELEQGYQSGGIDYDSRRREKAIEKDRLYAMMKLRAISNGFHTKNKTLMLAYRNPLNGLDCSIPTNYERELIYNLEHAVHHMALMKIGVRAVADIKLPDHFGVAASTIEFRRATCAQ